MARTESVAVAGYYPTPDGQIPLIAQHLALRPWTSEHSPTSKGALAVLDPCAGDGAAIRKLLDCLLGAEHGSEDERTEVKLYLCEMEKTRYDSDDWSHFVCSLLLLCKPGSPEAAEAQAMAERLPAPRYHHQASAAKLYQQDSDALRGRKDEHFYAPSICNTKLTWNEGKLRLDGIESGSVAAAERALSCLSALGAWRWSEVCGERLYQAVPEPRRHPLAQYIVNRHKELFDFLILDEGHEYATDGSAQERAAHRLTTLGLPTILMTGSYMNGYAESMFTNSWALSPEFREEFDRGESGAFVDRYGYRKRLIQDRREGQVIAFGSHSDRVERSERDIGSAPGVLPLFLFRHLLPAAVTLHKADLRIDLPKCEEPPARALEPGPLEAEYLRLLKTLTAQIKRDRFEEGKAGKLFGALSELPSYLDRATVDVGNVEGSSAYEIRYPESCGGELVASAPLLPASTVLPKEKWMLETVKAELDEGRNVMVFGWHLGLLPRLKRLIEKHLDVEAPILWADKVATGKRQAWIDKEIVKKKRRVMIANPVAIQTGLNNLVHFATNIWHENPACNPIVYRQANGRIDRIGQTRPTRILFGTYASTLQAQLYELLIAKVAISTATDGLDPESALRASGVVEDEYLTGLSIGKQLWAMLSAEFTADEPVKTRRQKPIQALLWQRTA